MMGSEHKNTQPNKKEWDPKTGEVKKDHLDRASLSDEKKENNTSPGVSGQSSEVKTDEPLKNATYSEVATDREKDGHDYDSRSDKTKKTKKIITSIIVVVVGVIVVLGAVFAVGIYKFRWDRKYADNRYFNAVAAVYPLPVAFIDGRPVMLDGFMFNRGLLANFVKAQVTATGQQYDQGMFDETLGEIEANVVDKQLEDYLISRLAKKYDVKVTDQDVEDTYSQALEVGVTPEKQAETIQELYGISVDEFKDTVVRENVLRTRVGEAVTKDIDFDASAKEAADQAKTRLDNGEDFAAVATDVSEDSYTAPQGGDVGYVKSGQMPDDVESVVFALEPGAYSEVHSNDFGYSIFKVEDKRTAADDGAAEAKVRYIFFQKGFDSWLTKQKDEAKVWKIFGKADDADTQQ